MMERHGEAGNKIKCLPGLRVIFARVDVDHFSTGGREGMAPPGEQTTALRGETRIGMRPGGKTFRLHFYLSQDRRHSTHIDV